MILADENVYPMELPKPPLSNVQIELLKLYATDLSEEDLRELRAPLAQFYARKSVQKANEAWQAKGMTQHDMDKQYNMDKWLNWD